MRHTFVTIMELENHHCRWPTDGGLYCGSPTADVMHGCPYCAHHRAIAYAGGAHKRPLVRFQEAAR
jgi:hypothetical protein